MSIFFSSMSLIISLIAVLITLLIFRKTQKSSIRPYIVFFNSEKGMGDKTSWCIENVGNGPALNILIAGGTNQFEWNHEDITLLPAMTCNISKRLQWVKLHGALLATYTDICGREYTSICVHNKHTITEGNSFPNLEPRKFGYQIDGHTKWSR